MNIQEKGPAQILTRNTDTKLRKKSYQKSLVIKKLEAIANRTEQSKFPEIPPECLKPSEYMADSKKRLIECIIDFAKFEGHQAERVTNMGRLIDKQQTFTDVTGRTRTIGQKKWIKGTGTNGTADIHAVIKGRAIKIEVKHGRDRQSEPQRTYQSHIEQAGGIYVITSSFEQFFNWYNLKFGSDEK